MSKVYFSSRPRTGSENGGKEGEKMDKKSELEQLSQGDVTSSVKEELFDDSRFSDCE